MIDMWIQAIQAKHDQWELTILPTPNSHRPSERQLFRGKFSTANVGRVKLAVLTAAVWSWITSPKICTTFLLPFLYVLAADLS